MSRKKLFRVVIAGRPNVGKSSLFNRLVRRRRSIVHDLPGMTRDVLEVEARLPDDRVFRLVDTGGYDPEGKEKIPAAVREKAVAAIRSADLVLLVTDASAGVLPGDRAAARLIRESGRECVVVANKIDRREGSEGEVEAWALGFAEMLGVSAEHGTGVDDVQTLIGDRLDAGPAPDGAGAAEVEVVEPGAPTEAEGKPEIALAVVGRPNVGKSSLSNALLGEERAIVSEVAGTTRDSVDAEIAAAGRRFRLVDTAGIRRRGRTEQGPEVLSVVQARKRIEECDVALLVVDASLGPTGQDASVASYADEAGKGLVLLANKWDLAGQREEGTAEDFRAALANQIPFARQAPILLVSALTGRASRKSWRPPPRWPRTDTGGSRRASSIAFSGAPCATRRRAPPPGGTSRSSTSPRRESRRRRSLWSSTTPSPCTSRKSGASRTSCARQPTSRARRSGSSCVPAPDGTPSRAAADAQRRRAARPVRGRLPTWQRGKPRFTGPAEACRIAEVAPYVLRYWETEFPALSEGKDKGSAKLYTARDVKIIARIRELLYDEGFTVAGAKKRLEAEIVGGPFRRRAAPRPAPFRAPRYRARTLFAQGRRSRPADEVRGDAAAQAGSRPGSAFRIEGRRPGRGSRFGFRSQECPAGVEGDRPTARPGQEEVALGPPMRRL